MRPYWKILQKCEFTLPVSVVIISQEPSIRAAPVTHHRRRDSTPSTFGDLGILHPGNDQLTSHPQPHHARRHSEAGPLTRIRAESPPTDSRQMRRLRQDDLEAIRAARTQVGLSFTLVNFE